MPRYIDADALHKAYMELRNFKQDPQSGDWISLRAVPLTTVIRMLNEAPTIDAVEVVHGEWIKRHGTINCSVCKRSNWSACFEDTVRSFNFCPNCGADMREREGE